MDLLEELAVMVQHALDDLSQIPQDVEPINCLKSFWRTLSDRQSELERRGLG